MTLSVPDWRVERRTFSVALRDGTVADITVGDAYDDDIARPYLHLLNTQMVEMRPDFAPSEFASWAVLTRDPAWGDDIIVLARIDDVVVGGARASLPRTDNTEKVFARVDVTAGYRRRGLGSLILSTLESLLPADRHDIHLDSPCTQTDRAAREAFGTAHGYALAQVSVMMTLPLPLSAERQDELEALVGKRCAEYTIRTDVGGIPEDHLALACGQLQSVVEVEAPSGDIEWEASDVNLERYRDSVRRYQAAGESIIETLALDSRGDVVAHTVLFTDQQPENGMYQAGTYVSPAHRGRRLGLAVKLANLRRATTLHPHHRHIRTNTDEHNTAMLAVNTTMGFAPSSYNLTHTTRL